MFFRQSFLSNSRAGKILSQFEKRNWTLSFFWGAKSWSSRLKSGMRLNNQSRVLSSALILLIVIVVKQQKMSLFFSLARVSVCLSLGISYFDGFVSFALSPEQVAKLYNTGCCCCCIHYSLIFSCFYFRRSTVQVRCRSLSRSKSLFRI